jgi:hypothetical protein
LVARDRKDTISLAEVIEAGEMQRKKPREIVFGTVSASRLGRALFAQSLLKTRRITPF